VVNVGEKRNQENGVNGLDEERRYQVTTHQVIVPVVVSYICANPRHPVARYLPSAEKRTHRMTLEGAD
jgi:hypothetical protein